MTLNQKETTLLNDLKSQEQLCIRDLGKIRSPKAHVHRDGAKLVGDGIKAAQFRHGGKESKRVLPSRNAHGDPIALSDHFVVVQRSAGKAHDPLQFFHIDKPFPACIPYR